MTLLAVTVALFDGHPVAADDYYQFLDRYASHHQKATQHLWRNVKVAGRRTRYDSSYLPPTALSEDRFTAVANDSKLLYTGSGTGLGVHKGKNSTDGGLVTEDCAFDVEIKADGSPGVVGEAYLPWGSPKHLGGIYHGALHGLEIPLGWPLIRQYIGRGPNRYYRPDPARDGASYVVVPRSTFTTGTETRNGVECFVLRFESPKRERPQDVVYYLDPNTYLVLATEHIGLPLTSTGRVEPIRKVVEISYGPPAPNTGLPFPTRVKGECIGTDGKRYPAEDITFSEYRRYTPTPDQVDVEKVLRVKMPAVPPRPPEGQYLDPERPGELLPAVRGEGRPVWVWFAAAGGLAVAAAAVAVVVRRRRH